MPLPKPLSSLPQAFCEPRRESSTTVERGREPYTLLPTSTVVDRSQAGSPINEDVGRYTHPPIPSLAGHGSEES
ncbi:hypothetical protein NUW54_g4273 [Trametes sanguinea]|uniref:Uncharacterized protein n=1 Tax=Trametes sanguinea TaxID=158606 RepID=A0ACC1Q1Y1_9APHY|nr:hypothetical protein NUW54_g4273 [Trametes sanguinea]